MRKTFKIAGGLFLATVYLVAVFLFYGHCISADTFVYSDETKSDISYFSDLSFLVSEATLPSGTAYQPVVSTISTVSSAHFKEFSTIIKINSIILTNSFVSYRLQSVNFPIRLRKANLLFPFHGFW